MSIFGLVFYHVSIIKRRSKLDFFRAGHSLKRFYCMTMKLGLQAYQKYFQVSVDLGPRVSYFRTFVDHEKPEIGQNLNFWLFSLKKNHFLKTKTKKPGGHTVDRFRPRERTK